MFRSFSFSVFTDNYFTGNNKHVHTSLSENAMHTDTISNSIPQLFIQQKLQKSIHRGRAVSFIISELATFIFERTNQRVNEWTMECTYEWKKCTELHLARRFHFRNMKYQLQFIGFAHKNIKPLHNADVIIHIFIFETMECACADGCGGRESKC